MISQNRKLFFYSVFLLLFLIPGKFIFSVGLPLPLGYGTIDGTNGQALTQDNIEADFSCAQCDVKVYNDKLTGRFYLPVNGGGFVELHSSDDSWGVLNDGEGVLDGIAYSTTLGPILFSSDVNPNIAVTINPTNGEFSGYAYNAIVGPIRFECPGMACVKTTWRKIVLPVPVNGACGTAEKTYPASSTSYGTDTFCTSGDNPIPNPTFPTSDNPSAWTCGGQNGGIADYCTARLEAVIHEKNECVASSTESCNSSPNICGKINSGNKTCSSLGHWGACTAVTPSDDLCTLEQVAVEQERLADLPIPPESTISDSIKTVLPDEVASQIIDVVNHPTTNTVSTSVSVVGLAIGSSSSATAVLSVAPTVSNFFVLPMQLWNLLLSFLGIRKKGKKWGTVYDSVTMQPLDPVYVVLKDLQGKEIATSITDLDGRYGFSVKPGTYKISVNKADYTFPSQKLAGQTEDAIYHDLYFGEDIVVGEEGGVITKNIPMDRLNFNWNEWKKNEQGLMKFYKSRDKWIARISNFLFIFGFMFTLGSFAFKQVLFNYIILIFYIFISLVRNISILKVKKSGSVVGLDGNPLSFAILRFYSVAMPNNEFAHSISDKFGRFYRLLPNGEYIVKIEEKTGENTYSIVFTSGPIKVTEGLIKDDFKINLGKSG